MSDAYDKLQALRRQYADKLPGKLHQLEELWHKLLYVNWRTEHFQLLHRLVHSLAGSGRTFGFAELSKHAAELDTYIAALNQQHSSVGADEREHISQAIDQLVQAAAEHQPAPDQASPEPANATTPPPTIYVLDPDADAAQYLALQLQTLGMQTVTFTAAGPMIQRLQSQPPDAVITDTMLSAGELDGVEAIAEIRAALSSPIPVVFVSSRTDLNARLEAVRAGGDAYFTKPVDIDALADKLENLTAPQARYRHRVLIVDDDEQLAQHYAAVLENVGMRARTVSQPLLVIERIMEFKPDLILLDYYMPGCNGAELATVVRQDEAFMLTPIVFLTAATSPAIREQVMNLGVDDYLQKPIADHDLAAIVTERVRSAARVAHRVNRISSYDLATKTMNRGRFLQELDLALSTPSAGDGKRALIYFTLDDIAPLRESLGVAGTRQLASALAAALQNALSSQDVIAHFNNCVFTVLTGVRTDAEIHGLATALHRAAAAAPIRIGKHELVVSCSLGVSCHAGGPVSGPVVLAQAEHAAAQAVMAGGNRIVYHEAAEHSTTAVPTAESNSRLLKALEAHAFQLLYQPIIRLHGGQEEMYETLLRLVDDQGTTISPREFLPHLAKHGKLAEADRWVIEHAIAKLASTPHTRDKSVFFIKLSAAGLQHRMVFAWIRNAIREARIYDERRIVIEASERDIWPALEHIAPLVEGLRKVGCGFAIDHFGQSGHTAEILERVVPDFVKIQQPYMQDFAVSDTHQAQVKALVESAHRKGCEVVVGGIEDPRCLAILWQWGVRYFQGYFLRRPDSALDYDFDFEISSEEYSTF